MTATIHKIGGNRAPSLEPMFKLVAPGMNKVNAVILDRMQSEIPLIPELAGHLIAGGGKRMRPMLTLACAQLLDYPGDRHHKLAAAVEFIHTATLLHDDVVHGSTRPADSSGRRQARSIHFGMPATRRLSCATVVNAGRSFTSWCAHLFSFQRTAAVNSSPREN